MSVSELDVFNYFLTFSSLILGLGVTCLLDGMSKLIQNRKFLRIYWVHLVWALTIVLLQLEYWWSQWRIVSSVSEWTLLLFVVHILPVVILFLASDLIFPHSLIESEIELDFEEYYYSNIRTWIFVLLGSYLIIVGLQQILIGREEILSLNNAFRVSGIGIAALLYWSRNRILHSALSLFSLMLLVSYILTFSFSPLA